MTRFAALIASCFLAAGSASAGVNAAVMERAIRRAMQPGAPRPAGLARRILRPQKCAVPLVRAPLDYASAIPLKRAPLRDPNPSGRRGAVPLPTCGEETRQVRHVQ